MASSHVVFDGYSYEPPSYEEAQAQGRLNQSVYKPTVSQNPNVVMGGLRPLYVPNGYNHFSEYSAAKRQRKVRVACVTLVAVGSFILFILFIWRTSYFHHGSSFRSSYENSYYGNDEDSAAYRPDQDSSMISSNNYNGNPVNDDNEQEQLPNENVFDKTELGEHNDHPVNNGNEFTIRTNWQSSVLDDAHALAEKYLKELESKEIGSSTENPVTLTKKAREQSNFLLDFHDTFIKNGGYDPKTDKFDED